MNNMLHHASLPVADLRQSSKLYDAALSTLGYRQVCSGKGFVGYGIEDNKDKFSIKAVNTARSAGAGFHLAFSAPSTDAVNQFHAAAILNGATDDGAPGYREHYGPYYYAAFIVDLDGHRIEAVINENSSD